MSISAQVLPPTMPAMNYVRALWSYSPREWDGIDDIFSFLRAWFSGKVTTYLVSDDGAPMGVCHVDYRTEIPEGHFAFHDSAKGRAVEGIKQSLEAVWASGLDRIRGEIRAANVAGIAAIKRAGGKVIGRFTKDNQDYVRVEIWQFN
jgi:RimJ/RimL family protein N-acetyltransferase